MSRQITLKDVAKHAGVSFQTVSKVLRNEMKVTAETRARIETAVAELAYQPNISARSLRTQTSQLLGYSWQPSIYNISPILEQFLQTLVETAGTSNYHVLLFPHLQADMAATFRDLVTTKRVDGFILSDLNYDDSRVALLLELDFPFVAFGRSNPEWSFAYVDVDGRAGFRMVTNHLLEQGHKRIAALGWPPNSRVGTDRLNGYLEAMKQAGIQVRSEWILGGDGAAEFGYWAANKLLDLPESNRPTGIVTVEDMQAVGAIHAVQDRGLVVGADIGITGFDDSPFVQCVTPSLTSLRQPIQEIGESVVTLLTEIINGNEPEEKHIILPPELIIRESSVGFNRIL